MQLRALLAELDRCRRKPIFCPTATGSGTVMATKISGIIPILALGLAAQLPCHAAPATDAQSAAPSSAQLDALIEDIKAHKEMCDKVDPGQAEQVKQCSNEQAALVARQKRLGVSNATVNAKLKTRGWRWP